mmetsp:Transcript_60791/g.144842  ORF Transcript_60791/g.144842 Transcript_60791/m.144842 type:complete len:346 (-) Transcript_60791:54-1091(-)
MSKEDDSAEDKSPLKAGLERIQQLAPQVLDVLKQAEPFLRAAYPYCHIAKGYVMQVYAVLEPYHTEEVAEIIFALALLFLGGHFAMTIACYQAFRMSGSKIIAKSWKELTESYQTSMRALQKDSEARALFDANHDDDFGPLEVFSGLRDIALAKSEQEQAKARQKILVIMKCIDPNKFADAFVGLWTGLVAILATLRSRFIHAVSIGASAGEQVAKTVLPLVSPRLYACFPQHTQWVDFFLRSAAALAGIITSFILIRVISAFNSAIQGARLLLTTLMHMGARKRWFDVKTIKEDQLRIFVWVVAAVGFLAQLSSGFNLPFLIKLPLCPVYILEYVLTIIAARPF